MATINDIQNSLAQIGNDLGADINGLLDAKISLVANIKEAAEYKIQTFTALISSEQAGRDEQIKYVVEAIDYQVALIASRIATPQNEKAAA